MDGEQKIADHLNHDTSWLRGVGRGHSIAFSASVAAHLLILVALVFLLPQIERAHHDWVLAYVVEFDRSGAVGRGAGAGDAGASSSPAAAHDGAAAAKPRPPHHAHQRAARAEAEPPRTAPKTAAIAASPVPGDAAIAARSKPVVPAASAGTSGARGDVAAAAAGGFGAHGGEGGVGSGGGLGNGTGSGSAHAAYAQNPGPKYPIEARRRAQEGTVLLRIKVSADGSVEQVEIAQSSGFDLLDESALETVRARWRFVPALRAGTPIESWCMVPIRFALTEARAN
jgi:periplasmic protein TonB